MEEIIDDKTCGECRFYHPILKHEGACTATSELRKTCDFTTGCAIGGVYPKPPLTNGDVIRQGGNRALKDVIFGNRCYYCAFKTENDCCSKPNSKDCPDGIEAWLNAPAESQLYDAIQNVIKDGAKNAIDIHEAAYAPDMNVATKESEGCNE